MLRVLQWVSVGFGAIAAAGTLLSFSRSPHWFMRLWDFPRVQLAVLAAVSGTLYAVLLFRGHVLDWVFLVTTLVCVLWQGRKIYPYTPLAPVQVKRSERRFPSLDRTDTPRRSTFRLLISNVSMDNCQYDRFLGVVRENDPDLVLAVEADDRWTRALEVLTATYRYVVRRPQNNYYGLMLLSRLPLIDPRVEFLVQDDIPSVHTAVDLPSGDRVFVYGLHPRPPEPIRDQYSTPRDAELVLVGRAIRAAGDRPTVVAGDLNDVAWSTTNDLFLRISGLLDPRVGRGFYNTYSANTPLFRYPLDHVFHSKHFRLVELRRLPHIGSDHFPLLIELSYEPEARLDQPQMQQRPEDSHEAEKKLEDQSEAARSGDDRPGRE